MRESTKDRLAFFAGSMTAVGLCTVALGLALDKFDILESDVEPSVVVNFDDLSNSGATIFPIGTQDCPEGGQPVAETDSPVAASYTIDGDPYVSAYIQATDLYQLSNGAVAYCGPGFESNGLPTIGNTVFIDRP